MKFKIDENLPAECAALLRKVGFPADTVAEERLPGASDASLDMDFANVRAYPPDIHEGIIVFRSKSHDRSGLVSQLQRVRPVLKQKSAEKEFWIVEQNRIRIRDS